EIVMGAFDRNGAAALGYRPLLLDAVVLVAVTAALVSAIPAVGALLAIAMLTVPALTARLWSDRMVPTMALAGAIGVLSALLGLCAAALWGVAAGGAIALAAGACFMVSLATTEIRRSLRLRRGSRCIAR
ncbi:MAG: metal ABC transporter permease, partial [Ilumatobacteraceae bacterium]